MYGRETKDKIILAALALFSKRVISKVSLEEMAYQAGVTRVTVYPYFPDKKELARQAYLYVEQIFQNGLTNLEQNPQVDWESVLDRIGQRARLLD